MKPDENICNKLSYMSHLMPVMRNIPSNKPLMEQYTEHYRLGHGMDEQSDLFIKLFGLEFYLKCKQEVYKQIFRQ